MAVVRCPKHELPYNEDNPRGCPACAAEEDGETHRSGSAVWKRPGSDDEPSGREGPGSPGAGVDSDSIVRSIESQLNAATYRFTYPVRRMGRWIKAQAKARPGWATLVALVGVIFLIVLIGRIGGPEFVPQPIPQAATGEVLPLAVEPGQPLDVMFSILGTRVPRPHPTESRLERYVYTLDLMVDALNGAVYALRLRTPDRSWRGLQVGMPMPEAEGALTMLGRFSSRDDGQGEPQIKDGYQIYPSQVTVPVSTITAEMRPPNGCLDVTVEFRPAISGVLVDGGLRSPVVGRGGDAVNWVAMEIYVQDRTGERGVRNRLLCR